MRNIETIQGIKVKGWELIHELNYGKCQENFISPQITDREEFHN